MADVAEDVKVIQRAQPPPQPPPQVQAQAQAAAKPEIPAAIPYNTKTATQIKTFYTFKSKKPDQYRVGDDGSLNIYAKTGELESSIKLKSYRPITTEERGTMESYRLDKLAGLDVVYEH